MQKNTSVSRLPCESIVVRVFGAGWRDLPVSDFDGALGVAIIRSILDGVTPSLHDLSVHLGVSTDRLRPPYMRLNMNGLFLRGRIYRDRKALNGNSIYAWCYYAGYASGAIGNVSWEPRSWESRKRS